MKPLESSEKAGQGLCLVLVETNPTAYLPIYYAILKKNEMIILAIGRVILGFICYYNTLFFSSPPPQQVPAEVCQLKGAVYIEEVAVFATYRVFVEQVEAFATLRVFEEEAQTFANEPGHWYITDVRGFADFSIYLERSKGLADFSIAFTEYASAAGCP